MIRFGTKVQLMVFLLITVIGVAYVGATYIGINPVDKPYTVYLNLPNTGGVFTNADVAERGVVIGKVGSITINKNKIGVVVALKIDHGKKVPTGTGPNDRITAKVSNLSAVGEQYVELEPNADGAPYLKPGDFVGGKSYEGTVPVDDATILLNLKNLLASINVKDLSTVITELGKGFNDLGPSLQALIDNGNALTQSAIDALPATLKLVDEGRTVLDTQEDVSSELKSFAASFSDLTGEISKDDPSLRRILDSGVGASKQLQALLANNAPVLPTLLNNLNTFTGIQDVRLPQTRAVLELFPAIVGDSFYALPAAAKGAQTTARFGLVTDLGSYCKAGYASTKKRTNLANAWGGAANLDAYCHGNNSSLDSSGLDVRGARNTPPPGGVDGANITNSSPYDGPHYGSSFPGSGKVGACGTPTCPTTSKATKATKATKVPGAGSSAAASPDTVIPVPYDPSTGMVEGLNGKLYQLGLNGPVAPAFGSSSYTWLLIAPTMR